MAKKHITRRMAVERLEDRSTPSAPFNFAHHESNNVANDTKAQAAIFTISPDQCGHGHGHHGQSGNNGATLDNGPAYTGDPSGDPPSQTGSILVNGWDKPYYV